METQEIISAESLTETITTSGQPTRAQFDAIREAGYSVVINLAMADSGHRGEMVGFGDVFQHFAGRSAACGRNSRAPRLAI